MSKTRTLYKNRASLVGKNTALLRFILSFACLLLVFHSEK